MILLGALAHNSWRDISGYLFGVYHAVEALRYDGTDSEVQHVFVEGDSNVETVTASVKNKKTEVTASSFNDRMGGGNSGI